MKDMATVNEFERKRQMNILRSECYNNASILLQNRDLSRDILPDEVFKLARRLFDEAIKQRFLDWKPKEV